MHQGSWCQADTALCTENSIIIKHQGKWDAKSQRTHVECVDNLNAVKRWLEIFQRYYLHNIFNKIFLVIYNSERWASWLLGKLTKPVSSNDKQGWSWLHCSLRELCRVKLCANSASKITARSYCHFSAWISHHIESSYFFE